jgi:hypothetical protein
MLMVDSPWAFGWLLSKIALHSTLMPVGLVAMEISVHHAGRSRYALCPTDRVGVHAAFLVTRVIRDTWRGSMHTTPLVAPKYGR